MAKGVWFALCPRKIRYISCLWAEIKYLKSAGTPISKLNPDMILQSEMKLYFTRKYLLRGYFLGVLTHTTAWDRLGEVNKFSSLGLKLHIDSSGSITMMKLVVWRDTGCRMLASFALPSTLVASVWLWMYFCHPWNTSDNFVQWNFLFRWLFFVTGRDGQTDGQT